MASPGGAGRLSAAPANPVLATRGLCRNFGALRVADAIDFQLAAGARHALIGPNGAGKTTFVNLLSGALNPSAGRIELLGHDVTRLGQAERSRRGLTRTYQINRLFTGLTVLDNVCLAVAERRGIGHRLWRPLGRYRELLDEAMTLLASFRLDADALTPVGQLAYGRQRLVELVIALGQRPRVLLLDEPAAGVPSAENRLILDAIERLDDELALLIIEHDMDIVFRFAETVTVLVAGRVLVAGSPEEIAADREVRALYLGERG